MSRAVLLSILGTVKAPLYVSCCSRLSCTPPKVPEKLTQFAMFASFHAASTYLFRNTAKTGPPNENETVTTRLPLDALSCSISALSSEKYPPGLSQSEGPFRQS